jgi:hypothetical protein
VAGVRPIQPIERVENPLSLDSLLTISIIPPKCRFEVDDVEDEWQYCIVTNLTIYGRFLVSCFRDAASVFKKAFDTLNPGWLFRDARLLDIDMH